MKKLFQLLLLLGCLLYPFSPPPGQKSDRVNLHGMIFYDGFT